MNIKPLPRYEPASVEVETGIGCYDELSMKESATGDYIKRDELLARLNHLLTEACDPAETDTLYTLIRLVEA